MHQEQKIRIVGGTILTGTQTNIIDVELTDSVNIHGLRLEALLVGTTASQPQHCNLVLYCMPEALVVPIISDANITADDAYQDFMWVYTKCVAPSLNLQRYLVLLLLKRPELAPREHI